MSGPILQGGFRGAILATLRRRSFDAGCTICTAGLPSKESTGRSLFGEPGAMDGVLRGCGRKNAPWQVPIAPRSLHSLTSIRAKSVGPGDESRSFALTMHAVIYPVLSILLRLEWRGRAI